MLAKREFRKIYPKSSWKDVRHVLHCSELLLEVAFAIRLYSCWWTFVIVDRIQSRALVSTGQLIQTAVEDTLAVEEQPEI